MLKALMNGRSGLASNQNRIDAISNNIANINTNGYKRVDVAFEDIFYENLDKLGIPITSDNKENLIQGSGTRADKLIRNFTQGDIVQTGNPEDLAIVGDGYFRLRDESGNYYYARSGEFKLNADNELVHSSGYKLDVINFNKNEIGEDVTVKEDGTIFSKDKEIGRIFLYNSLSDNGINSLGDNLFSITEPKIVSNANIKQGYVETSNVKLDKELTDMIVTQRAYEINSRVIKASDEMWQIANNLRNK